MSKKRVVYLVDNKNRDLMGASLIAHYIRESGHECFLEPLEAYQAALGAHKPHLMIFNHLLASHLAAYSRRLNSLGIKVAVLSNEGILYDKDVLDFNSHTMCLLRFSGSV